MSGTKDDGTLRSFASGATRDTSEGKLVYNGFLSPFVLKQFARYMNMNRVQSDGKLRAANNWQRGIDMNAYRESLSRHYHEFWEEVEKRDCFTSDCPRQSDIDLMAAASGMLFNVMGYMLEWLKKNDEVRFDDDEPTPEMQERLDKIQAKDENISDTGRPHNNCKCDLGPYTSYSEDDVVAGIITQEEQKENHKEITYVLFPECSSCRWGDLTKREEPCRACLQAAKLTGEQFSLYMEANHTTR